MRAIASVWIGWLGSIREKLPKKMLVINQDPTTARDDISSPGVQGIKRSPTRVSKGKLKCRAVSESKVPRPNSTILNIVPSSEG